MGHIFKNGLTKICDNFPRVPLIKTKQLKRQDKQDLYDLRISIQCIMYIRIYCIDTRTHTHLTQTHTHIYIYIYISEYISVVYMIKL